MAKFVLLALTREDPPTYEQIGSVVEVDRPAVAVRQAMEEHISEDGAKLPDGTKGFVAVPFRSFHRFTVKVEQAPRVKVSEVDSGGKKVEFAADERLPEVEPEPVEA